MPSFYFEQLLQSGLNGMDQQGITAAVLQIASVLLVLSLFWGVYESYAQSGDLRALAFAGIKYLALGLVFVNYQGAFRLLNSTFNGIADAIYSLSGSTDVIKAWDNSLSQAWQTNPSWFSALWTMVTGGTSAVVSGLLTLVGYLLLPFTYTLFTLFYALYGSILYVAGPFVLALMPSRILGQIGRSFLVNVLIFHSWGLLYAILQALMSALQITNPMQFSGSFLQAFVGSSQMILMSVASVLLAVMVAMIPFIASRIVRGDVGNAFFCVLNGAVQASTMATGLVFAASDGLARSHLLAVDGPPMPPPAPLSFGHSTAHPRVSLIGHEMPPQPMAPASTSRQNIDSQIAVDSAPSASPPPLPSGAGRETTPSGDASGNRSSLETRHHSFDENRSKN
jgi:hypothetical protein